MLSRYHTSQEWFNALRAFRLELLKHIEDELMNEREASAAAEKRAEKEKAKEAREHEEATASKAMEKEGIEAEPLTEPLPNETGIELTPEGARAFGRIKGF